MSELRVEEATRVTPALVAAMGRLVPQLSPGTPPPDEAWLRRLVEDERCALLLARDATGEIVGTLTLVWYAVPVGLRAWIEDVVVDAAARGQGVGEALVREALRRAEALGAPDVRLTSNPAREAANRLYPRLGFRRRETNTYRYHFHEP